jgi:4-hydroxythreonine-4-phosphate dehydrogenase
MRPPRIAISLGDVTGIGPEVALKALAAQDNSDGARYLLIGDFEHINALNRKLGLNLSLEILKSELPDFTAEEIAQQREGGTTQIKVTQLGAKEQEGTAVLAVLGKKPQKDGRIFVLTPSHEILPKNLPRGAPEAAQAAVGWLREGAQRCLDGEVDALVTAPVNKEAIVRSGQAFVGQTEFLSELASAKRTAMMLLGQDDRGHWLRVALVTTHFPLKLVPEQITQEKVEMTIELATQACRDLGLKRSRVAVCGLNPHAGEGGEMGTEELTTIEPAVKSAKGRGFDVIGPMSADSLFYYAYRGDYDAVVAMYHDQGLVPLKMIGFETGINWTLGLPFVRTSPDHGTAYDIAGKGRADARSMMAAIGLAKKLSIMRHS